MAERDSRERRENVLLGAGCAIIGVWILAVIVQVMFPEHVVPPAVHGIVALLVPIMFGGAAWQSRKQEP